MNELPPKDYLNRALQAMGFDEKERSDLIDVYTKGVAAGLPYDPIELGRAIMEQRNRGAISRLPIKQTWYIRLKFWFSRKWREGYRAGRKWWETRL